MKPGYLQLAHFHDHFAVNIWSDPECCGDLIDQSDFRMGRIDGLRMEEVDLSLLGLGRVNLRLSVFVNGATATYLAKSREGVWDEFNDALEQLR
jgi:hypothetical protein